MISKKCLVVFIGSFFYAYASFANHKTFRFDTLIVYQLLSLDTASKVAVKKELNTYNENQQLIEKKVMIYDQKKDLWLPQKRFVLQYFKSEIMVNCFNNESSNQEIQFGRYILLLDEHQHIIECTKLDKDRYADKYYRRSKYELTYKNDTLRSKIFFNEGTIFYKNEETIFDYSKNLVFIHEKIFEESGVEKSASDKEVSFSNQQIKSIQYYNEKKVCLYKDTFYYKKDTLIHMDAFKYSGGNEKIKTLSHRIFYKELKGQIESATLLYYNKAQQPVADARNYYIKYSTSTKNLQQILGILQYDIDYFLK